MNGQAERLSGYIYRQVDGGDFALGVCLGSNRPELFFFLAAPDHAFAHTTNHEQSRLVECIVCLHVRTYAIGRHNLYTRGT